MVRFSSLVFGVFCLAFLVGCDDEKDPLVIPASYDGVDFQTNAATELTVLTQVKALRDEAFKGRTNGVTVSADALNTLYTAGSPNLKALNTPYYSGKLEGSSGFLSELAKASGNTYSLGATDGNGGTFGGYLFDENGVEMEQLIEKGMFGAALYNHALTILNGTLDSKTSDRVLAIYGAHPSFPNSTDGTKHSNPDRYAASYAARRDKNDGKGFYTAMQKSLITLQAAIKAGNDYRKEQQNAVKEIKQSWERSNAATIVNYLNAAISKLSETNPTDNQKGGAMHEISESIGFIKGWRTIAQDQKIITDTQIDEVLALLRAPEGGTPSVYQFAVSPETEILKLQDAIAKLKSIYSFSNEEMEDFKKNWVSVQSR